MDISKIIDNPFFKMARNFIGEAKIQFDCEKKVLKVTKADGTTSETTFDDIERLVNG